MRQASINEIWGQFHRIARHPESLVLTEDEWTDVACLGYHETDPSCKLIGVLA